MKIRFFRNVRFPRDWEINFIGKRLNLRIGRSQVTLWRDYEPVASWLASKAA